jgi:uncharacterized protein DUF6789
MSTKSFQTSSTGRKVIYGTMAGFIAGMVMLVIMTALMTMLKLPANSFAMLLGAMVGQTGQNALIAGIVLHFIASMAIGAIFGTVKSRISKLMTSGLFTGIIFGVITGIIAFVVLFLPVSVTLLPQNMMNLISMMNPSMNSQAIMPIILTGSLLSHLLFGLVLGIAATIIERLFAKRNQKGCAIATP